MAQLSFKRYATTSSLNTAKAEGSLQEGNVVFDAELKILYIVTIKSGNIELEPYYGTNTTYAFSGDGTNTIKIKPSNANEQSITINNVIQAANATNAENAEALNGYTYESLYESPQDWMNKVGCVKTIIIEGDSDKFYPVGILLPVDKNWYSGISIYKNLGYRTPAYKGNHSNGTSAMWAVYQGRYTGWDGNGNFIRTITVKQPYAPLIARADVTTYDNGYLIVWLRGGGSEYKIARTVKFKTDSEIKIGLDDPTNFESDTYKWNCSPIPLDDIDKYNKGIISVGYDSFNARYSEAAATATIASKATLSDLATKADYPTGFALRREPTWGTLTTGNGYTYITDWCTSNDSDIGMWEKSGQLSMQIDGFFYQNKGQYKVLDQNNWSDYIGISSNPVQNSVNAVSVPWSGIQNKPNLVTLDTEQTISASKTFNSSVNITSELTSSSANLGDLIVNGTSKFLNTINGNLKGDVDGNAKTATNAITATTADKVAKSLKWGSKTYNGSSEQTITAADLGLSGAMHFLGITTSNINEGSTLSSIIIDGKSVTQSKGDVVLYSHSEYIWTGSKWEELGSEQSFALKSVEIKAGDGLTGGGTLEATRIISHADTSSQGSITTGGRTYINKIELDNFGHVTSLSTGTESDQTDISGNAATATKALQDWNGNEIAKSYTRQKIIRAPFKDYVDFVILLCSLDNTNDIADFFCQGTFFLKRINILRNQIQRIDVQVGKNDSSSDPVFASFSATDSRNKPKLIRCTYNGIKYAGLYFYIPNSGYQDSISRSIFIGNASNLDDVKAVNIYNNKTKTVLNSEIYNSIEYIKNNILGTTLYGTPYITYDGGEHFHEIISKYNIAEQSVKEAVMAGQIASHSLWGTTFNGTQDLTGSITLSSGFAIYGAREINNERYTNNHTLCLGYTNHDYVEWKECGGVWKFLQPYNNIDILQVSLGNSNYFLNNVGIGNSTPTYKLDVTGTARITGDIYASKFIGDLEGNAKSANSAAEASKATNDGSGNNIASTYITDVSTSGQNLVVTKNGKNTTTPIDIREANLQWGGKNFADDYGPIDAAMVSELGANRFAFLNPAGITLEYSKDGGNTWTEETAVSIKKSLFSDGNIPFFIGQRDGGKDATPNWKNRVTLNASLCGLYCEFKKIVIEASIEGSGGCWVLIEYSDNGESWSRMSYSNIGGWSGWNIIQTATTRFGNTIYSNAKYLRFTFSISVASADYRNLQVYRILAFGGTAWSAPSNMAKNGHLYSYDSDQNATFPATVTARQLKGNLDWSYIQNTPSYGSNDLGLYKISTDPTGFVTDTVAVTKDDITALGIPGTCVTKINGKTGDVTLNIPDKYTLSLADMANVWANSELNVTGGSLKFGNTIITSEFITLSGANSSTLTMLDASGDLVLTNGKIKSNLGFYQTSDIRKKTIESNIDVDFDKLASIPKKYFYWKDKKLSGRQIGTIAQELLKIYPELVSKNENGYYSVDYARLSIVALAAIDELNNRLKCLENIQ